MQIRLNLTSDDIKIIRAIRELVDDGYTKPAAVKELIRNGLIAKNEPINLTVNIENGNLPTIDSGFAYPEPEIDSKNDDDAMVNAFEGWQ